VKYTPEIAKKRSNSLPLVADTGGLHSTKKIKISFTTQQIYPLKISKNGVYFTTSQTHSRDGWRSTDLWDQK
jgi:hypothetical protein